jgi:hypothetical protein
MDRFPFSRSGELRLALPEIPPRVGRARLDSGAIPSPIRPRPEGSRGRFSPRRPHAFRSDSSAISSRPAGFLPEFPIICSQFRGAFPKRPTLFPRSSPTQALRFGASDTPAIRRDSAATQLRLHGGERYFTAPRPLCSTVPPGRPHPSLVNGSLPRFFVKKTIKRR